MKTVLLAEWLDGKKNLLYRELLKTDLAVDAFGAPHMKGGYSDAPISAVSFFYGKQVLTVLNALLHIMFPSLDSHLEINVQTWAAF